MSGVTRLAQATVGRRGSEHFVLLDLVRGLAALTVFLSHLRGGSFVEYGALPAEQHTPLVAALFGISRLGHEAVLIFFVLSGYFVGGAVIRRVAEGRFDVREYAIDRATRILLPLVPAVVLTAVVGSFIYGREPSLLQIGANMVGLNDIVAPTIEGNAPLWSLAFEIWFYVFAGSLAYLASARKRASLAIVAMSAATIAFSYLDARYLLFWSIGAAAMLLDGRRGTTWLAVAGLSLMTLAILGLQLSTESKSFTHIAILPRPALEAIVCSGFALAIPALVGASVWFSSRQLHAVSRFISDRSYSIYLFHYPLLWALGTVYAKSIFLDLSSILQFAPKGAFALAGCLLMHLIFEANTERVRQYLKLRFGIASAARTAV